MLLVLGSSDSIIRAEEIVPDLEDTLGSDAFEVEVLCAGHEVAFVKGSEVADAASSFWDRCSQGTLGAPL